MGGHPSWLPPPRSTGPSSSTPPTAGPRARSACSAELRAGLYRQAPTHAHEHRQALAMLRLCAVCSEIVLSVRRLFGSAAHFWALASGAGGALRITLCLLSCPHALAKKK